MTKPILLLDVDGVLNVVGPDWAERLVRLRPGGPPFHPTPYIRKFLRWVWPRFRVYWCTAWRESANRIATWAGLPEAPVLKETRSYIRRQTDLARRKSPMRWLKDRGDWKLEAAKKAIGRRDGTVFWLEDGISDEAQGWLARHHRGFYLATDSFEGVTPAHARLLAELGGINGKPHE